MKTKLNYKAKTTISKGLAETLSIAIAIYLAKQIPLFSEYQELTIVIIAALLKMASNYSKHNLGIDFSKLVGKQ